MYTGFPEKLVPMLRCPHDLGHLRVNGEAEGVAGRVTTGRLACEACGRSYPVADGIVQMLDAASLDEESAYECKTRDEWADKDGGINDEDMAVRAHLDALRPSGGACLELGAGTGRFTAHLDGRFSGIVAVDFSGAALRAAGRRLDSRAEVGLVQADVTRLAVAPGEFARCLSTLTSNLPSPGHRAAMLRLAAIALTPGGRFVYSAHHYDLRSRYRKVPQEGHYRGSGIYRYLFTRQELLNESRAFFGSVRIDRRTIHLPSVMGRLGPVSAALGRLAERLPLTNRLAMLLIASAEKPVVAFPGPSNGRTP